MISYSNRLYLLRYYNFISTFTSLSDHREIFENEFQRILSLLASGSVKKQVWTTTISELISYCEARDSMNLKIENIHNCINIDLISSFNKDRYGNSDLTLLVVCKDEPKVIKFKNDTILNQISNLEDHHYHFDKFNKKLIITIPISIKSSKFKILLVFQVNIFYRNREVKGITN